MIAHLVLELHLSDSFSLKDKRQVLRSLRDRLRNRHNVAFSETDFQDIWQRARIEMVSVNSSRPVLEQMFNRIMDEVEEIAGPDSVQSCNLDFIG